MTLILAARTSELMAIASDRMLSTTTGAPRRRPAVKNVLFFSDMVFGYTGLAQLPGKDGKWQDTALWLTNLLADVGQRSVPLALSTLVDRANEAFERIYNANPAWPLYPHAFLGVGWERDENTPQGIRCSTTALVSNYHERDGKRVAPRNSFDLTSESYPPTNSKIQVVNIGVPLTGEDRRALGDRIDRIIECQTSIRPIEFVNVLKETIREVSKRLRDRYVGKDILGAAIPRNAALFPNVIAYQIQAKLGYHFSNRDTFAQKPAAGEAAEFYRFIDGRDGSIYSFPHIVAPGFEIWGTMCDRKTDFNLDGVLMKRAGRVSGFYDGVLRRTNQPKRRRQTGRRS
jgi:hypothetical protein